MDALGRPVKLTSGGVDWVNDVVYGPAGEMRQYLGNGNCTTETRSYNTRLQLTRLTVIGTGLPTVDLEYRYSATQNNGRITSLWP